MELLADTLVLVSAGLFAAMGGWALARPTRVVDRFGIDVTTLDGRNEIGAVYGGFGVAVAALLVFAATTDGRGELWIPSIVSVQCLGMATGRIVSMARDRTRGSRTVWLFVVVELALAVALFGSHVLR